jgi:Cu(I)/Ag(I) efflux system membrane fusion protein
VTSHIVERPAGFPLKRLVLIALPLIAVAIAYAATRNGSQTEPARATQHASQGPAVGSEPVMLSPASAEKIGVTYAKAETGPLTNEIRSVAQVTVDETRIKVVSARVDGWVETLPANFTGQSVTAGTPLLTLYAPMFVTAQEEFLLARRLLNDVSSSSDETKRGTTDLVSSARSRLAYLGASPQDIARLENSGFAQRTMVLRAPTSGFVVEKNVLQGQRIMAGETLYKIADLRYVWLDGEVYERDLRFIAIGQTVSVELQAFPGESYAGTVAFIYPTLNPDTRTARIRVRLSNERNRLMPGMYATIRLVSSSSAERLSVPRTAVLSTGERHVVFVKRSDGMLEPRDVEIGIATPDRVEIINGLAAGETVVSSATFLVDAESSLGTAFGGMGNMPGMDIGAPRKKE